MGLERATSATSAEPVGDDLRGHGGDVLALRAQAVHRSSTPTAWPIRVQDTLPFRYRGILEVDLEICTGCLACERACPIDCIVIDAKKDKQTKEMMLTRFDIDIAKCMYCGLCSEPCPTGSIHHTPEFEGADYSLESLVRRFVKDAGGGLQAEEGPRDRSGDRADPGARHALPGRVRQPRRRRSRGRR